LPRVGAFAIAGRYPDRPRYDLKSAWKRLCSEAGLEGVTIHDIRRTFGLRVARSSGLHIASKLLRHSDVRITEKVYCPLGLDELAVAMEKAQRTSVLASGAIKSFPTK
jgi:integrase